MNNRFVYIVCEFVAFLGIVISLEVVNAILQALVLLVSLAAGIIALIKQSKGVSKPFWKGLVLGLFLTAVVWIIVSFLI